MLSDLWWQEGVSPVTCCHTDFFHPLHNVRSIGRLSTGYHQQESFYCLRLFASKEIIQIPSLSLPSRAKTPFSFNAERSRSTVRWLTDKVSDIQGVGRGKDDGLELSGS